ncbi:YXWGXW repeat-containing protein [Castellaniella caeni]|uniref:YXWGXW repeat-containing protein n=1 Tax=Castellaniella caeni TaxID=266123 RepID=UPI0021555D7F|nr:hypothetical protein [Castellaniella caeni]
MNGKTVDLAMHDVAPRDTTRQFPRLAPLALVCALAGAPALLLPAAAQAAVSIGIGITLAPPALPVVVQPVAPAPGYIWTPGYWAWNGGGYDWVDGVWLMPPAVGLLWTPGWWGWSDGAYLWHAGYWGPQVGFYGGVNYGFGYFGVGYVGGYWRDRNFYYNRAVNNVNVTNIRNVYVDKTVINHVSHDRVSYNGGRGGLTAMPSAEQRRYAEQRHQNLPPMQAGRRDNAPATRPAEARGPGGSARQPDMHRAGAQAAQRAPTERAPSEHRQPMAAQQPETRQPTANRPSEMRPPTFNRQPEARPQAPRQESRPEPRQAAPQPQFRQQSARQPEARPAEQPFRQRAEAPAREDRSGAHRPAHRGEEHR